MAIYDVACTPEYTRNSEGDTALLADGRLLLAWTRFHGAEDHARAEIWGVESLDWGASWGEARILVPADEARQNVMSVSLLRERASGELLLFYLCKHSFSDLQVRVRRSSDEGRIWSAPLTVSTRAGYDVMNNARVLQLANGRLLAPVAWAADLSVSPHQSCMCYLSDDGGHSWHMSAGEVCLEGGVGCQEPGVLELPGGEVLMWLRTDRDCIYAARSRDGGETWGSAEPIRDLPAPEAPATLGLLPDGALLAIYNHRPDGARAGWQGRTPLSAARSEDGGRSWQRLADIESDLTQCYAYTSLRCYGQRMVLTYYVWPHSAPTPFSQTALRLRVLPVSTFES